MFLSKQLVVIGGGAAGFFCAVNAARMNPELKVSIIEKSNKILAKVKVSGGGRCNVTHQFFEISEMIKQYPRGANFLKKAFHQFFTTDTIKWFEERGVKLKAEADGRMFPVTDSSQTIIDCLIEEANKYGVEIMIKTEIRGMRYENGKFQIELSDFRLLTSDFVCIACGGFPKLAQFDWIKNLNHTIIEPVPSLFTFNMPGNSITQLMGVSVHDVKIKIAGAKLEERGPLLITHWGMSGPVVLKLSAWGARELAGSSYQFAIHINWLPEYNENTLREKFTALRQQLAGQKIINKNPFQLPQRLWEYFLNQVNINNEIRWADLPAKHQNQLISLLCNGEFAVKGKTTFKEEFVTAGGVSLNEIDVNTMQSKKVRHLYFAGEILDVDGITGGFNFQNAWTSGWIAAKAIAGESKV
ncbi:MAG: NAD(P)/FAD-dependent oxidoreductase [Sphingobacteriales bacterium]|nr:NAD(P)/FAD-dependent oxidoreductase [Sphingobacteriales bacterium]MBI3720016.1 NAD(P)/FAD-dependent oxidoreductase [Sphingobacteriales bacterium]